MRVSSVSAPEVLADNVASVAGLSTDDVVVLLYTAVASKLAGVDVTSLGAASGIEDVSVLVSLDGTSLTLW